MRLVEEIEGRSVEMEVPEETAFQLLAAVRVSRDRLALAVAAERPDERDDGRTVPPSLAAARRFLLRGEPVPEWVGLMAMIERCQRLWGVSGDYLACAGRESAGVGFAAGTGSAAGKR